MRKFALNRRYGFRYPVDAVAQVGDLRDFNLMNHSGRPVRVLASIPVSFGFQSGGAHCVPISIEKHERGLISRGVFLLAVLLLVSLAFGCSRQEVVSVPPRVVKLGTVGSPELSPGRAYFGITQSARRASLSFQVGGRIEKLPVEMGDSVNEGQLLAQLDETPFELRVKQAEADLVSAQAAVHERQSVYDSEKHLLPEGATTQLEYDQAEAALALAKSRQEIAEAALRLAKRDLSNTKLVAPMAGRIVRRHVQNYTEVAPGTPIFEQDGEGDLEIAVSVPEHFKIAVGMEVLVTLKSDNHGNVSGVVTKIGSRSDVGSTIPVLVKLKNNLAGLRTGTAAEVVFPPGDQTQSLMLPVSAIIPDKAGNSGSIFIYDNGIVKKRAILLGKPVGEGFIVESGVKQGEQIVIAGGTFLTDGQAVRPFIIPGEEGGLRTKSTAE